MPLGRGGTRNAAYQSGVEDKIRCRPDERDEACLERHCPGARVGDGRHAQRHERHILRVSLPATVSTPASVTVFFPRYIHNDR